MAAFKRILLPGESGWEIWSIGDGVAASSKEVDVEDGGTIKDSSDLLVAIGTRALAFVPAWVNSTDPEIQQGVIASEIADLGISPTPGSDPDQLSVSLVTLDSKRALLTATVLEDVQELPDIAGIPPAFVPHARLMSGAPDSILVWKELGRLIIAFYRGTKLTYAQALTHSRATPELSNEIACMITSLSGADIIGKPSGIVWIADQSDAGIDQLGERLAINVSHRTRTGPSPEVLTSITGTNPEERALVPPQFLAAESAKKTRGRILQLVLVSALVLAMLFAASWLHLEKKQQKNEELQAQIDEIQPEVFQIQEAQAQWELFQSAIDPDLFAVEIFHRLSSVLPRSRLRLTQFKIDKFGEELIIAGEAEDNNTTLTLGDDLKKKAYLRHYKWDFPSPSFLPDRRAKFWAKGTRTGDAPTIDE